MKYLQQRQMDVQRNEPEPVLQNFDDIPLIRTDINLSGEDFMSEKSRNSRIQEEQIISKITLKVSDQTKTMVAEQNILLEQRLTLQNTQMGQRITLQNNEMEQRLKQEFILQTQRMQKRLMVFFEEALKKNTQRERSRQKVRVRQFDYRGQDGLHGKGGKDGKDGIRVEDEEGSERDDNESAENQQTGSHRQKIYIQTKKGLTTISEASSILKLSKWKIEEEVAKLGTKNERRRNMNKNNA